MCFYKICGIGRGIFVYSFHSACDIIKKNVETGRNKYVDNVFSKNQFNIWYF